MIKRINFIAIISLFCLVFCEAGLCQSQSEYALIRRPVFTNPLIWKLTKSVAWSEWGTQLFVDQVSVAQGYFMEVIDDTIYSLHSAVSFHLDNGWNRVLYSECLDNWIRAYGDRGSGTNQFLWPARIDCIAPCNEDSMYEYYFIYVADASNDRIVKLLYRWWPPGAPNYQIITWYGVISGWGLDLPKDLDINDGGTFLSIDDNYLWVLNGHEIKRFTLDGVLRKTYGSYGCDGAVEHFCRPTAVACGRDPFATEQWSNNNDIYVADDGNHRIVWLRKSSGSETVSWLKELYYDEGAHIVDLEVDNFGQVWAVDWETGRIYKFTSDLYPLCYFGSWGTGENQFYYPGSFSNTGGYLGCGDAFVAEAWTDSSGGQYFAIGTDVLDFEVASSVDDRWHYVNYILADPSQVTIKIYNKSNILVKTLFEDMELSGACTHVWDGTSGARVPVPEGNYRIVLIDSSRYGDPETNEPVNVVTKEAWVHHSNTYGVAPWNLVAYQSGPDKVTLEWEYFPYTYGVFAIYCDGCLCGTTEELFVWTYTDSGLIPGRSYVYWVRGYFASEGYPYSQSPPSNADTVTLSTFGSFTAPEEFPIRRIQGIDNDFSSFSAIPSTLDWSGDTLADLAIESTIGFPGKFAEVSVLLANETPICGFNFLIKMGGWPVANFNTVDISQDSILIGSDWVDYPVRECFIDTTGSLISDFNSLFSRGQPGDTALPDCKYLWVKGWPHPDSFIPADPSYRLLFKFGVDLFCMCDADTERNGTFDIPFGYLVDTSGYCVTFKYHMGELFPWAWSVPGDANNDSSAGLADATYLVNYLFFDGPPPCIWEAADANANCEVDLADAVYILNWLYGGGPPPQPGCYCPYKNEE